MQAFQNNSAETISIVTLSRVLRSSRDSVGFAESTRIQRPKTAEISCGVGLMPRTHVSNAGSKPGAGMDWIERGGKLRRRIKGKSHPDC